MDNQIPFEIPWNSILWLVVLGSLAFWYYYQAYKKYRIQIIYIWVFCVVIFVAALLAFSEVKRTIIKEKIAAGGLISVEGSVKNYEKYTGMYGFFVGSDYFVIKKKDLYCVHGRGLVIPDENVQIRYIDLGRVFGGEEGKCILYFNRQAGYDG